MRQSDLWKYGLAVAVAASVALAGLYWFQNSQRSTPRNAHSTGSDELSERIDPPVRCTFSAGQRLAFSFRQSSTVRIDPTALMPPGAAGSGAQGADDQDRVLHGEFLWRALARSDGAPFTIAATFRGLEPQGEDVELPAPRDVYRQPMLLEIDDRCRIQRVAAPAGASSEVMQQWQLLLSLLEFVGPAEEGTAQWKTTQRDTTGTYLAFYDTEEPAGRIQRRRKDYLDVRGPRSVELRARILDSLGHARLANDGAWFDFIEVVEEVEVTTTNGRVFVHARTRADVERRATVPDDPFWAQAIDAASYRWRSLGDLPQESANARAEKTPDVADWSADEALAEFRRQLEAATTMRAAVDLMVGYLRLSPEHARSIFDRLVDGQFLPDERSVLFLAFQRAGGEACRDILIEATSHPDLPEADRLRAFSALADIPEPDATVTDALETAWKDGGPERAESRAAMLAMGKLAGRQELDDAGRARVNEVLRGELADRRDPGRRRLALEAIGNGGASTVETFADDVRALTASDDAGEREAAHETLRRLDVAPDHSHLLSELETEADRDVRDQIGRRLVKSASDAPPAALRTAEAMLGSNRDPQIRRVLIEVLGAHSDTDPLARRALVNHFPRETVRELLVLIGRYIPASEL